MELTAGKDLAAIDFADGGRISLGQQYEGRVCTRLLVIEEAGQMGMVPWVQVWRDGKPECQYNAALLEGADYAQEPETKP